jgi:AraC-like DNA-binding protein
MPEPLTPTRPNALFRHWAPSSPRLDATAEPLIWHDSVVGIWPVAHFLAVPWHDHEFYEVAFVIQGTGFHFSASREAPIRRGTVIFVPPGTAHGYRAGHDVVVVNCLFRAELAEFELLWASRDDALMTLFGRAAAQPGQTVDHVVAQLDSDTLDECIAELDAIRQREPGERSHASEIGHLLLALDVVARHGRYQTRTSPERRPATPRVVSAVLDLIEQDLTRHWTLADLSSEVFVGSFHLAHEFKRWVGAAPIAYANRRRVERAAALLAGTDDSIGAIGRAVGWPEPASFSRHFGKAFGVSPREYRRRRTTRQGT